MTLRILSALARSLELALDPAALMRSAGLPPDAWQEEFLRSPAARLLLLCCRQAGKSTVSACMALYEALFRPGSLILLLSPSLRQSQELFRKVADFQAKLGIPIPVKEESSLRVEFENGSRIIALPGSEETIRGYSGVSLLIVDEASRVDDALYCAIRPMLAVSNGRLVALTTPYGKRGWFYEAWTGTGTWERVMLKAGDCPRISKNFLDEERATLGDRWYRQEYECEFLDTEDSVFSSDDIRAALNPAIKPLWS